MKKIRFLKEARAEFLNQTEYYEKARPGSGVRFRLAVEEVVKQIAVFPKMGTPEVASCRRVVVSGFPFSVIFKEVGEEIILIAIAHGKRRPGYWGSRSP